LGNCGEKYAVFEVSLGDNRRNSGVLVSKQPAETKM